MLFEVFYDPIFEVEASEGREQGEVDLKGPAHAAMEEAFEKQKQ